KTTRTSHYRMSQSVQEQRDKKQESRNQIGYPIGTLRPMRVNAREPVDSQIPRKQDKDNNPAYINVDIDTGNLADTQRARHDTTPSPLVSPELEAPAAVECGSVASRLIELVTPALARRKGRC